LAQRGLYSDPIAENAGVTEATKVTETPKTAQEVRDDALLAEYEEFRNWKRNKRLQNKTK